MWNHQHENGNCGAEQSVFEILETTWDFVENLFIKKSWLSYIIQLQNLKIVIKCCTIIHMYAQMFELKLLFSVLCDKKRLDFPIRHIIFHKSIIQANKFIILSAAWLSQADKKGENKTINKLFVCTKRNLTKLQLNKWN